MPGRTPPGSGSPVRVTDNVGNPWEREQGEARNVLCPYVRSFAMCPSSNQIPTLTQNACSTIMPRHKGCAVSIRQWLQRLPQGSKRKRPHEETTHPTRTAILNAPATQYQMKLIKSVPALTPREVEIVRLLRKGYSNKEIAQELGIAVTTVKWNMTNILGKFEVQSSRQLLALLAKLPPDDSREWTILE